MIETSLVFASSTFQFSLCSSTTLFKQSQPTELSYSSSAVCNFAIWDCSLYRGRLSFVCNAMHTCDHNGEATERGVVNENDTRDFFTRVKHEFWIVFKVFVESKEGGRQERFLPTGSKIRVAMYLLDIGVEIESIFPWKSSSFDLLWTRITIHIGVNRIELGEE